MRGEYKMTEAQLKKLLEACRPFPYLVVKGIPPRSPQEKANDAWAALGRELGFKPMTVRPLSGKGLEHFTAEPIDRRPKEGSRENGSH